MLAHESAKSVLAERTRGLRRGIAAAPGTAGRRASIYSAIRICLHAGGSADIKSGFGATDGFGSASFLVNHQSRSLPQPSSVGGIGCALQSVLSFGQLMRMWKW